MIPSAAIEKWPEKGVGEGQSRPFLARGGMKLERDVGKLCNLLPLPPFIRQPAS